MAAKIRKVSESGSIVSRFFTIFFVFYGFTCAKLRHFVRPTLLFFSPFHQSIQSICRFKGKKGQEKAINADWGIRQKENVDHYLIVYVLFWYRQTP